MTFQDFRSGGSPMMIGPPPGNKYVDTRQAIARMLMQQGTSTAPIQHWTQGASRMVQALMGAHLHKQSANDRSTADDALVRGLTAKPWTNPDTGETPPGQNVGGIAGALSAVGNLPENNPYAGPLSKRLALMQFERGEDQKRRDADAIFAREQYDLERKHGIEDYGTKKRIDQQYAKPTETFETVQSPYGRGGVGQRNSVTGQISGYQPPEGKGGPFEGNGMDAQALNILLQGNPASPEYRAAYAHYGRPKVSFDQRTGQQVTIAPDMDPFRKPLDIPQPPIGQPQGTQPSQGQPLPPQGPPQAPTAPLPAPPDGHLPTQPQGASHPLQQGGVRISPVEGAIPNFNADQGKAATFADRIAAANQVLATLDTEGASLRGRVFEHIPGGNYAQTPEFQVMDRARRDFINATLRRESGAAIADHEFANARLQYFPQPGDHPAVIEHKRKARELALTGMVRSAGPSYKPVTVQPAQKPKLTKQDILNDPVLLKRLQGLLQNQAGTEGELGGLR